MGYEGDISSSPGVFGANSLPEARFFVGISIQVQ
jgi:hypothetical protein